MASDIYNEQIERSKIGEAMENLEANPDFAVFKEQVLENIHKGAFEAFKKVDPSDSVAVIETQQMGKVVDIIYSTMNDLVEEGRVIRHNLKHSNPEDGGIA